jgi:Tol biopolymer transport system component
VAGLSRLFIWTVPALLLPAAFMHHIQASTAVAACELPPMVRLGSSTVGPATTDFAGLSGDGRFVAVATSVALTSGDTNGLYDVFVFDRQECAIELISVDAGGGPSNGGSFLAALSADGRFVSFISLASDLVANDTNATTDVFVRDRESGSTTRVSVGPAGQQSGFGATLLDISADGQAVLFQTCADLLNNPAICTGNGLYVRDLSGPSTELLAMNSVTAPCAPQGSIASDGRYVAFATCEPDLIPEQNELANDFDFDIFLYDRVADVTTLVTAGSAQQCGSFGPRLAGNGRYIAFHSECATHVVGDTNGFSDVFVHDLQTQTMARVSVDRLGRQGNSGAFQPAISDDGRYVAFVSGSANLVPGDTPAAQDIFVHDRQTGAIQKASRSESGIDGDVHSFTPIELSGSGGLVCFGSAAANLVPFDINSTTIDTYCARWQELSAPPNVDLMLNGLFDGAGGHPVLPWQMWAQPDPLTDVVWFILDSLHFYRDTDATQAVALQSTFGQILAGAPLVAEFDLGNSSGARKRVSVLLHDADFSDLHVCTFWLDAHAPLATYRMATHTTERWANATIAFYASTIGSAGGHYLLDNVSLEYDPAGSGDSTECFDPDAPAATMDPPGPDLIGNGGFEAGLPPWGTFGQIVWQITSDVFEFQRPPGQPAGVVLQNTGQALSADQVLTATFDLGNSSAVRKRVTVLLHDADFSDLSACTFWLAPSAPLATYQMRAYGSRPWTNAMLSVYAATIGPETWTRLDNVSLRRTSGSPVSGTNCSEPGSLPSISPASRLPPARIPSRAAGQPVRRGVGRGTPAGFRPAPGAWPPGHGYETIDLRGGQAAIRFESWLVAADARATVQVSLDGIAWASVLDVPPSDAWLTIDLPVDAFAGRVIGLRFVLDDAVLPAGTGGDWWWVKDLRAR